MSNFENNRLQRDKCEEKDKIAKENLAKYFYDLSKTTFTAMVIGALLPLVGLTEGTMLASIISILFGITFSSSLAYLANYIMKH